MEPHPGHIHNAENVAGVVAWIWPTRTPGMGHLSTTRKQATEQPVPTDEVEVVLALWGFKYDGEWTHWPGPLHEVNPPPALWAGYDEIR